MTDDTNPDSRTDPDPRTDATDDSDSPSKPEPHTDGGTATGADETALDPWGSSTITDYETLFTEFGIEAFDDVLPEVPNPHYLMRRGVIFGHREYQRITEAMRAGDPFAVLSGLAPTGDPHIGHKLVFDEIIWHQRQGGDAYTLIADMEARSARDLDWKEIDDHARDYLLSLLALGFDPDDGEIYRQSTNRKLQDLAFELGTKANFSEFQAIYGFDGETSVSHMQAVVTQAADILYPQLEKPIPTVIPVGPDQDPHVRFTRDLAARTRYFGVTEAYASFEASEDERELIAGAYEALSAERADDPEADDVRCIHAADWLADDATDEPDSDDVDSMDDSATTARDRAIAKLEAAGKEPIRPRVRFLDRNATSHSFEALIERVEGEKRVYEGHIDSFELDREAATELAREVELADGGYGFVPPSSIYHRFMTGLTGGKMSSSVPASHISLLDDPEDGYDKVKAATTGGRETAALQRELGGKADECPVYELYAYLLAADDDEYTKRVYDECVDGERLCGDCKEEAATLMREFLADHQEKREEAEELLADLDVDLDSSHR